MNTVLNHSDLSTTHIWAFSILSLFRYQKESFHLNNCTPVFPAMPEWSLSSTAPWGMGSPNRKPENYSGFRSQNEGIHHPLINSIILSVHSTRRCLCKHLQLFFRPKVFLSFQMALSRNLLNNRYYLDKYFNLWKEELKIRELTFKY